MILKEQIRRFLPRRRRDHRILFGPLRGARMVTSWHDYPGAILGTTERSLLGWFADNVHPGETWIDAGAHYGYTAIALSRLVQASGRVFAFEPILSTASCMMRTRKLNRLRQLTVIPLGLDRDRAVRAIELPTVRGMADSTIGSRGWDERILVTSLDGLWPTFCGDNPEIHGIKIDVQAMELGVLAGAREILLRWKPVLVIEFHRGVDRNRILRLLSLCGYSVAWEPVDPAGPQDVLSDDSSYVFRPEVKKCESSSTRSSTVRN